MDSLELSKRRNPPGIDRPLALEQMMIVPTLMQNRTKLTTIHNRV